jgi:hypothetical protein
MRYTQSQIRDLLGIPVETFRSWRSAIPALSRCRGHGPAFTPGDVVALAIVAELVRDYGVRIGTVGERLDQLFQACRGSSWLALESCCVLIDTSSVGILQVGELSGREFKRSALVVPCAPIVNRLRGSLAEAEPDSAQGRLRFPPAMVASGRRQQ